MILEPVSFFGYLEIRHLSVIVVSFDRYPFGIDYMVRDDMILNVIRLLCFDW